jgi:ubiquinone/menaquinone biosynthesis C-methylase UbiE
MTAAHQTLVAKQFGAHASAYVTSAVHASGEDLDQIAKLAADIKPSRALDLGCGGGHVSFALSPHCKEVVAYDLSHEMLGVVSLEAGKRALGNIVTHQGRVEALPFPDASFDLVATRYSVHHWHDVPKAFAEAKRVLRPGGRAIFADNTSPGVPLFDTWLQAIELLRDPSHVRGYTVAEWTRLLGDAGFVPNTVVTRRKRLEFAPWITRLATPPVFVQAIKALHAVMPKEAAAYFELEADGSFTFDTMTIEATRR